MSELLKRFRRYVRVDTRAVDETEDYPSSPGQLELGKVLAAEMRELGLADVKVSEHGIVMGTLPGNVDGAPTIAWLSHMDTSPEAPGADVKPVVHRNYDGKDIVLPGDPSQVIRVADCEELADLKGKTLITSDGTTLLGADDKAGIAVILTAVEELFAKPELEHGPIRVVFTPDEEVGRGTEHVDIGEIDATCAYTLDGEGAGGLENETFSADMATVKVVGANIHPGLAYGKMVNALRVAGDFLTRLPSGMAPETTKERDGFLHPFTMEGGVAGVTIKVLLRSFVTEELEQQAKILHDAAEATMAAHPGSRVELEIKKQYRNMKEGLDKEPRAVQRAEEALKRIGIEPKHEAIRGGTDGSRLTEMGLPTPNLSCGMHNFHCQREFACLEEMETAVRGLVELAQLWARD
jgi:tripeptide aminopeptidase